MNPRRCLRHLRDAYGRPYQVFDDVRAVSPTASQWSAEQLERAKRISSLITTLHIHNTTKSNSALK
ncbi:MAG: hypothetical protein KGL35_31785 [Bradyrhizobium sp.]|nr:hypothetical protein [Bradyrhizobium sp.]